jgi:hypothetical protein
MIQIKYLPPQFFFFIKESIQVITYDYSQIFKNDQGNNKYAPE